MTAERKLILLLILGFLLTSTMISGCTEKKEDIDVSSSEIAYNYDTRTVKHGEEGETISTPAGIVVKSWNIFVDKVVVTMENEQDTPIFVEELLLDVSFDDDMSTFRHYKATVNTDIGAGESRSVSVHIHQINNWEKPHVVAIVVV